MSNKMLLIILLVAFLAMGFRAYSQDSVKRNSISLSGGGQTLAIGLNYGYRFPLSNKLFIKPRAGLGTTFSEAMAVPVSLDVGYGRTWSFAISGGIHNRFNFDPDISTQAEMDDYLNNPNSSWLLRSSPDLPYDQYLNAGLRLGYSGKSWFFASLGFFGVWDRWPDAKSDRKWQYNLSGFGPEFEIGFQF